MKHGPDCRPRNVGQRAEWLAIDWAQGVGITVDVLLDACTTEHVAIGGDGIEQRQGADRALEVLDDLGVVDIHVRLLGEPVKSQFSISIFQTWKLARACWKAELALPSGKLGHSDCEIFEN